MYTNKSPYLSSCQIYFPSIFRIHRISFVAVYLDDAASGPYCNPNSGAAPTDVRPFRRKNPKEIDETSAYQRPEYSTDSRTIQRALQLLTAQYTFTGQYQALFGAVIFYFLFSTFDSSRESQVTLAAPPQHALNLDSLFQPQKNLHPAYPSNDSLPLVNFHPFSPQFSLP